MKTRDSLDVDLNQYFLALERYAGKIAVDELRQALSAHGIEGRFVIGSGERQRDGTVTFYGDRDYARFTSDGKLYWKLADTINMSASVPVHAAILFIGGLFGKEELWGTDPAINALYSARGCWTHCSKEPCDTSAFNAPNIAFNLVNFEISAMQALIAGMIDWAKREDEFPGGIDPDDITDIMASEKYKRIETADDTEEKQNLLREAIAEIVKTESGYEYAEKYGNTTCKIKNTACNVTFPNAGTYSY